MRYYLLPENNKQFKANLHSHTTLSDGGKTPEEMKAIYKERGYSVLAITDHGKLIDHSALDDEDFIMLTAVEFWVGGGDKKLGGFDRAMEFNLFAKDQHNASLEPFKAMGKNYSFEYMQFVTSPPSPKLPAEKIRTSAIFSTSSRRTRIRLAELCHSMATIFFIVILRQ